MSVKSKSIEAIKEIRKREEYHYEKAKFCREHNMTLETLLHVEMENELRRLANKLENILDTGYVTINED